MKEKCFSKFIVKILSPRFIKKDKIFKIIAINYYIFFTTS